MGKCSDRDNFVKLFYASRSISDLARKLEYKLKDEKCPGGVSQVIKRYIDEYQLDKNFLLGQGWSKGKTRESDPDIERQAIQKEFPWDKAFAFGSQIQNQKLLKRLVRAGKKKYECERCKLCEWIGESIVLELHHTNGIHHDNREENLQILCPNCHSQVERLNEKIKRIKKKENHAITMLKTLKKCSDCSNKIGKGATTGRCIECSQKNQRRVKRPDQDTLKNMIKNKSWTSIGKEFGVSDNAVRKWAKKYGLIG